MWFSIRQESTLLCVKRRVYSVCTSGYVSYEVSVINNARWETAAFRVYTEDTAWTMATIPRDVSCPVTCPSRPSVSHHREAIYDLAELLPHNRKDSRERHEWSFIQPKLGHWTPLPSYPITLPYCPVSPAKTPPLPIKPPPTCFFLTCI